MLQDLRYAFRQLAHHRGFSLVAVLTLTVGIGANTAIFSAVNAVLLRPLPVPALERVAVVRQNLPTLSMTDTELAPGDAMELAERGDLFQALGGFTPSEWNLTGSGEPMRLSGALTVGEFFQVFGLAPHLGRLYTHEESVSGAHEVVVLGHALWLEMTGGDPGAIGTTIQLDGQAREVVGVLPPGFSHPRGVQIYKPMNYTPELAEQRGRMITTVVARLREGVTFPQLASGLDAQSAAWSEARNPGGGFVQELYAVPFVEYVAGPFRRIVLILMGAVGLVLLLACVNVASLQLVRGTGRGRELAVRTAIGAGRARIVRQLLVESLVLAAAGGAAGLALGHLLLRSVGRWDAARVHGLEGVGLDGAALAFTAAATLVAAAASGAIPALRLARAQPAEVLRGSGTGISADAPRNRLLKAAVAVQVALALVLLLGAGLMVQSLARLLSTDPGFRGDAVLSAQLSLPTSRYDNEARQAAFYDALLERAAALPGVEAVGITWALPFSDQIRDSGPLGLPGRPAAAEGDPERHAEYRVADAGYFRAMGIPLVRGRLFDASDHAEAERVVLVDENFAATFFPGEDPVGQPIAHARGDATIVGVVGRVDHGEVGVIEKPITYYHYPQTWTRQAAVVMRTAVEPASVAPLLRSVVREIDPQLPVYDVATMQARVLRSASDRRMAVAALSAFSAAALLLASLGVYGVMRYSAGQRARELGVRIALGARREEVVRMVVGQGVAVTVAGLALGLAAALALTRLMGGMLYGIGARDPATFAAAAALLFGIAVLAAYLPARRASRVDPMVVLRAE